MTHEPRPQQRRLRWGCQIVLLALLGGLCGCSPSESTKAAETRRYRAQVALGEKLFADPRLSGDGRMRCATCHQPALAFSDGRSVSVGIGGRPGTRNAPSLLAAPSMAHLFWDGREERLESAVLGPFTNPVEMGLASPAELIARVKANAHYQQLFEQAFPDDAHVVDVDHLGLALAAYIRSLPRRSSSFDRYQSGQRKALSPEQIAGLELFVGKAQCGTCHHLEEHPAPLADQEFHHVGVGDAAFAGQVGRLVERLNVPRDALGALVLTEADVAGLGHFVITRKAKDLAAFRTPSLRNVAVTAPYMHDGSVRTLEDAVDQELYYRGLNQGRPISLTVPERRQLTAFLHSLTDAPYVGAKPAAAP